MKAIFTLKPFWLLYLLALLPNYIFAQDGSLDQSFGNQGKLLLEFPRESVAYDVVQQNDGKLIVVGSTTVAPFELYIARLNPDGSLDPSFGTGGKVIMSDIGIPTNSAIGKRVALRSDGKIVIVVSGNDGIRQQIVILRLNADGSIDNSNNAGKVYVQPQFILNGGLNAGLAVAIQPDNKILVAGTSFNGTYNEAVVFRVLESGSIDSGFGRFRWFSFGGADTYPSVIRIQKDGKVVVGMSVAASSSASDLIVVRLNPDGSFDNSFNQYGIRSVDIARGFDGLNDLVIQEDGRILAAGYGRVSGDINYALARLNPDGSTDFSFGFEGKVNFQLNSLNNIAYDVNVQKDGKIIVAGSSERSSTSVTSTFTVIKLNNDGSFDKSFGTNGTVSYDFGTGGYNVLYDALIQNDGQIVVAGAAVAKSATNQTVRGFGIMRLNNMVGPTPPYTNNYNAGAQGGFVLVGDAKKISTTPLCFELTTDRLSQIGAVWADNHVQTFNLAGSYTIAADIYFGAQDNGADGVAFVMQPAGTTVLGERGGGLGYMGIPSSFVVEFDTYHNDEPWFDVGDPQADHIGFMKNGSPYHKGPQSGALLPPIPLPVNIEDGQYHHVEFKWNAVAKTMTVSFLGNTYTYTGNIVDSIFGGNPNVYFGFTAATGSPLINVTQNIQRVCNILVIKNDPAPGVTESGLTARPNPTTGDVNLKLEKNLRGKGQLRVLSSNGALIAQQQLTLYGAGQLIPLDLHKAAAGIYVIEIISENGTVTQKVVKY